MKKQIFTTPLPQAFSLLIALLFLCASTFAKTNPPSDFLFAPNLYSYSPLTTLDSTKIDPCTKYKKNKKTGTVLMVAGGSAMLFGYLIASKGANNLDTKTTSFGTTLLTVGSIGSLGGFILFLVNHNNATANKCAIKLTGTSNSVGLAFKF